MPAICYPAAGGAKQITLSSESELIQEDVAHWPGQESKARLLVERRPANSKIRFSA
jgi:hypothetical protein